MLQLSIVLYSQNGPPFLSGDVAMLLASGCRLLLVLVSGELVVAQQRLLNCYLLGPKIGCVCLQNVGLGGAGRKAGTIT